jgi:tripartite-type tricarboxylate transporter receptor subunit TctC
MKIFIALILSLFTTLSLANPQLTIVVGYLPGGDTDVLARLFATHLSVLLDKQVIVENKVGASGSIASKFVSSAASDGTVIMLAPSTFVTAPIFNQNIKYNPIDDFTPIMQLSGQGMVAVVNSNTGVKNINDLIKANKEKRIAYFGSPGVGTPMHILGEMFNRSAGTDMLHVPFKGNSEIVSNMLGNQISFTWITMLPVIPHVESNKMNIIGVASSKRSPFYPNIPTLSEQGIKDIEVDSWLGFLGPKNLNKEALAELNAKLNEVINMPSVKEKLKALAMSPTGTDPETFKHTIKKDIETFTRVKKNLGTQIEY